MSQRRSKNSPKVKGVISAVELMEMEFPPPYHPLAVIDGDNIVLSPPEYGQDTYEIPWRSASSPTAVLDWIYQIQHKTWATPEMVYDLVTAFDVVLDGAQHWLHRKNAETR